MNKKIFSTKFTALAEILPVLGNMESKLLTVLLALGIRQIILP